MSHTGTRTVVVGEAGKGSNAMTHYGPRSVESLLPSEYTQGSGEKVQVVKFRFDTLPVASTEDQSVLVIPANSYIESAILRVTTGFLGGTSYDIGLQQADGTEIDNNGIFAAILLAEINVIGETVIDGGALVNLLAGIGAADGQVVVVATGTFTAGEAELQIVYRTLDDRGSF